MDRNPKKAAPLIRRMRMTKKKEKEKSEENRPNTI